MNVEVKAQKTYGRGVLGRLRAILDNNILPVIGGESDGKVVKFPQFAPFLPPYPFESQSIDTEAARLNVRLPKVLDAMLFTNKRLKDASYIEAMGGEDFGNITRIAMRTAVLEPQDPQTVIRTVYGGTSQMPLRALSGLLPALVYMDNFRKAGVVVPQLQMIFADHISSAANKHITLEDATRESTRFASLARAYIGTFFPELASNTLMLRDTPVEPGTIIGDELAEVSTVADEVISDQTRQALAIKSNGNGTGSYYGAAHLLVHDILLKGAFTPVLDGQPFMTDPKTIISIGGRQERFFYGLRHEIKIHLPERYRQLLTLQFFTRHQVPPYYMAADGDVRMSDGFGETRIGLAAKYDLDYLQNASFLRGSLQRFLEVKL